jgi:uncharacterized protein involved in outer membrane biogenesis
LNKRWLLLGSPVALLLVLGLGFAVGESMGWPFLVAPLQSRLQQKLGHSVSLRAAPDGGPAQAALHLWGGIRFQSPVLEIAAPDWSKAPYLVSAQDIDVHLRYGDVWRAWQGQQLVVQALAARQLTAYLERAADGRATWQLAAGGTAPAPHVQSMDVRAGTVHYTDAPLALSLDAQLSLSSSAPTLSAAQKPQSSLQTPQSRILRGTATGRFRKDAFKLSLQSTGALPWEVQGAQGTPVAIKLAASIGRALLDFDGTAQDFLHLNGLDGTFRVQGPSLAAVGEPLGVTLPTTPPFLATGRVQRSGARWSLALRTAEVGSSQIGGDFVFDTAATPPRLSGSLKGRLLKLADLASAVGAVAPSGAPRVKLLPTRPFDLASLRAMDADVLIAIDQIDANTRLLEPLRPFAAHLQLTAGVLTLTDINARTAQGHLAGTLALNGQKDRAHWVAALRWDGVQLQSWIHQQRAAKLPPYVTGQLQGFATLQGTGRSTAEILGSLQGDMGASVTHGTLSHLLVEMGGLDLAESLGVFFKGDNALVLDCAVVDLSVASGTLRPRLLVLDTSDSTVWLDGSVSLATEQLNLRAVVAPKDFSVLTLRSPLHIEGSFARPNVSIEKAPLGLKLGTSLLLGLINPLAALLPLVDTGSQKDARANAASCQARMHQKLQRALPALKR